MLMSTVRFAGRRAAAAAVVRTTAAHITKSATARIITSGTRGRRNAFARQVSNMPATGRDTPAARATAVTGSLASADAPRGIHGTRQRGLAFVRGRTGVR
mgnify:FL=1